MREVEIIFFFVFEDEKRKEEKRPKTYHNRDALPERPLLYRRELVDDGLERAGVLLLARKCFFFERARIDGGTEVEREK